MLMIIKCCNCFEKLKVTIPVSFSFIIFIISFYILFCNLLYTPPNGLPNFQKNQAEKKKEKLDKTLSLRWSLLDLSALFLSGVG